MVRIIKAEFIKNMKRKDIQTTIFLAVLLPFLVTYLAHKKVVIISSWHSPLENTFMIAFLWGIMIFPLLIIVSSANSLSKEIENGSIKLILSKPLHRRHIFIAKLTFLFCICLGISMLVFLSSYFSGLLFYGFNKAASVDKIGNISIPLWKSLLFTYILGFLGLLFCSTITLFFSCFFQTSISIMLPLVMLIFSQVLEGKKELWYFLPTYLYQFSTIQVHSKDPIKDGLISMILLIVYIGLLFTAGIMIFERKDFKG
ncbi:ABC transporter permease subunit [Thermoanaerobacter sp. X514]|jgi:ABC-2 type transport system permease protein|uniref:ABC transporter permease subunit n=1 Tax=Thermoanaerobacter sp. (strain X514) TaxID=399726 RepID=UPI0000E1D911|nr:ABC transporter permease subunit [Thermoanaerobacter sp. X514]MBZ4656667.1 hypothetical protein [Thermoanaerobacter sp.]MDN5325275.1 type transport system permease protein [Thermosipho sp. (in: thermotogales)]ABY91667.1 hypothetical protein Teth514_0351 [Thermoanaerobacter sp. X514]MDI3500967.1 type transport system permease protein [Thermoanaerobacter sp.]HCD10158.1 ABC transporter permease [Thermoanaerobacter sp.]